MRRSFAPVMIPAIVLGAVVLAGCAAGNPETTADGPAGFWLGLWHGMISFIALIIGLFSDTVAVYETNNTGGWYDFGFLLGVSMCWGGSHKTYRTVRPKTRREKEWEEVGRKVELKMRRKIREWAEAEPDEEWDVVGEKAEEKLKRKLKEWAEES